MQRNYHVRNEIFARNVLLSFYIFNFKILRRSFFSFNVSLNAVKSFRNSRGFNFNPKLYTLNTLYRFTE